MDENIIYLTIPKKYICIYHKLLVMMADLGKEILNDCTSSCKGTNKIIIDCWNMFQSALACRELGKTKQEQLFIDYIKKQITSIYKGTGSEEYDGNYIFIKNGEVYTKTSCKELDAEFDVDPSTGELFVTGEDSANVAIIDNNLIIK